MRLFQKSTTVAYNEAFITLGHVVKSLKLLILGSALAVSIGCATVVVRQDDNRSDFPACYPATAGDLMFGRWALTGAKLSLLGGSSSAWPLCPFFVAVALIDLPLSIVVDTLVLPADLTVARNERMTQASYAAIKKIWPAVAAFKQKNGRFPSDEEGLAVLTPTYLSVLPNDAWGTPFRYRLADVDRRPLISSAGSDKRFDTYPDLFDWYPGDIVVEPSQTNASYSQPVPQIEKR